MGGWVDGSDDTEGYFGYRVHNIHMAVWAVSGGHTYTRFRSRPSALVGGLVGNSTYVPPTLLRAASSPPRDVAAGARKSLH